MWHSTIYVYFLCTWTAKKSDTVTPKTKQRNALQAEIRKLQAVQQELQKNHEILKAEAQLNLLKKTTMPTATAQPSIPVPVQPPVHSLAKQKVGTTTGMSPQHGQNHMRQCVYLIAMHCIIMSECGVIPMGENLSHMVAHTICTTICTGAQHNQPHLGKCGHPIAMHCMVTSESSILSIERALAHVTVHEVRTANDTSAQQDKYRDMIRNDAKYTYKTPASKPTMLIGVYILILHCTTPEIPGKTWGEEHNDGQHHSPQKYQRRYTEHEWKY